MKISPLRLRLAGGFAFAFTIGLALLATFAFWYLRKESTRRFDVHLETITQEVLGKMQAELAVPTDSSFAAVARTVSRDWTDRADAFLLLSADGTVVTTLDPERFESRIAPLVAHASAGTPFNVNDAEPHLRVLVVDAAFANTVAETGTPSHIKARIVTFGSTEGIDTDAELLGALAAVVGPLIVLISLLAGYVLAGRALRPVRDLANSMAAIAPEDLHTRLVTTGSSTDEVSSVATEFNALLVRLQEAQKRNGQFVREAAHQIRTPLTLVLGEASHALTADEGRAVNDSARMQSTLGRIRTAAEVMRRRVDELFLMAEARTGEPVRLEQTVELDGLVLECTDLMRRRATETGHRLAIAVAEPVSIRGHAPLLHEALLELLENGCKHSTTTAPITVSCRVRVEAMQRFAAIEVASGGDSFQPPAPNAPDRVFSGMGLSIVRWVATAHHGELTVAHRDGMNYATLTFPLTV